MLLNLFCAKNTIILRFFYFSLIINLYFLIAMVISQFFNPTADLMPKGIPTKEAKPEFKHIQ